AAVSCGSADSHPTPGIAGPLAPGRTWACSCQPARAKARTAARPKRPRAPRTRTDSCGDMAAPGGCNGVIVGITPLFHNCLTLHSRYATLNRQFDWQLVR